MKGDDDVWWASYVSLKYRNSTFTSGYVTKPALGSDTFYARRTHKLVTVITRERDDVTELSRRPVSSAVYWKSRVGARYRCQVEKCHITCCIVGNINAYFHKRLFNPGTGNCNPSPWKARTCLSWIVNTETAYVIGDVRSQSFSGHGVGLVFQYQHQWGKYFGLGYLPR